MSGLDICITADLFFLFFLKNLFMLLVRSSVNDKCHCFAGVNLFFLTFPVMLIAVLGCIYLHLKNKRESSLERFFHFLHSIFGLFILVFNKCLLEKFFSLAFSCDFCL